MKKNILCLLLIFIVFWSVSISVQNFEISWPGVFALIWSGKASTPAVVYTMTVNEMEIPLPYKNIESILDIDHAKIYRPELFYRNGKDDLYNYVLLMEDGVTIAVAAYILTNYNQSALVILFKTWSQQLLQHKFVLSYANCLQKNLFLVLTDEQRQWLLQPDSNIYIAFTYFAKLLRENDILLIITPPT